MTAAIITTALRKIAAMKKRIRDIAGGTSSSKTYSILLILIDLAQRDKTPTLTSVVSESLPHLKKGAMLDFQNILKGRGYWKEDRWNATDHVYTFETGSKMEFFGADQPGKVHGPRRHRLFVNEANNISYAVFDQLEVRTSERIYFDYNPTVEFWAYGEDFNARNDVEKLTLTYRDNEALDPAIVASIEQRRDNKRWWRVYGEGLLGEAVGRIYTGWQIIDDVPHEAIIQPRGLDFGYTNDPTAIIDTYKHNGGIILDELAYATGMSNKAIGVLLLAQEQRGLTVADCSEPKSIDEIRSQGVTIVPAKKGPGSLLEGIDYLQGQRISVTKRSVNLIREYRSYLWATDREGKALNEPEPGQADHALDAVRYALTYNRIGETSENEEREKVRSILADDGLPSIL